MTASQRINPDWECTPADIQERIKAKEDLLLIDCRTRAERELVRIEDSLHIPQDELSANLETLFKQEEVSEMIVYCHHGVRSLAVVAEAELLADEIEVRARVHRAHDSKSSTRQRPDRRTRPPPPARRRATCSIARTRRRT